VGFCYFERGDVIKKIILVLVVLVVFVSPSLALEIDPEGLFGIHGTVWRKIGVWKTNIDNSDEFFGIDRGFYDGRVYGLKDQFCSHYSDYYYDILTVSFYKYGSTWVDGNNIAYYISEVGILFPLIGIGFVEVSEHLQECEFNVCYGGWYDPYYILLRKVNNWWHPSRDCPNLMSP